MNTRTMMLDLLRERTDLRENLPGYFYSAQILDRRVAELKDALGPRFGLLYSVKANPFGPVLKHLSGLGLGADVSSGGELAAAVENGFAPSAVSFCGPGKSAEELRAAVAGQVLTLVAESADELTALDRIARAQSRICDVTLRVQPADYVSATGRSMRNQASAFGISADQVGDVLRMAMGLKNILINGIHVHVGSMYFNVDWLLGNMRITAGIADQTRQILGRELARINFGGGLAIPYREGQTEIDLAQFRSAVADMLREPLFSSFPRQTDFLIEAGRFLSGPAGAYVTPIVGKKKSFGQNILVVDGGMNHHLAAVGFGQVLRAPFPAAVLRREERPGTETVRIVGNSCYGMDVLADSVELPTCLPGDSIVIFQSGAYGPSFSPKDFLSRAHAFESML